VAQPVQSENPRESRLIPELEALREARERSAGLAGFAVVADDPSDVQTAASERPAKAILDGFLRQYGTEKSGGSLPGLDWAGALPGPTEPISTWSEHRDDSGVCVVEGDFYEESFGRRARAGIDGSLAGDLLGQFSRRGPDCLRDLNGIFSGFVFLREGRRLWLFVDPMGGRMLYYRAENGRREAASDVYALSAGGRRLRLDPLSLNEDLVFGAPLQERTVFAGVRLVGAGCAVELDGRGARPHRYFRFPQRRSAMSRPEAAEMIAASMERSVRYLGLGGVPTTIGLSGGKDSRVALSAVLAAGLRPRAYTFRTDESDMDAQLGRRTAEAAGLPSEAINLHHADNTEEAVALSCDAAILSAGFSVGFQFLLLAAVVSRQSRILFTGYAGDCLSGSWAGVEPWRLRTVEELALSNRRMLGTVVPPALAAAVLPPELRVPERDLEEDWLDSYRREHAVSGDLLSTHIAIRLAQRNRRNAAAFYQSMRIASTPVHPFAARDVMDAYLTIPMALLKGQRAHIDAVTHRYPALGFPSWKTLGKLPLKWEPYTRVPLRLHYANRLRRRRGLPQLPSGDPFPQSDYLRTRRFADALSRASFLEQGYLRRELLPRIEPSFGGAVHKMAATVLHAEYGLGGALLLPPFFLSPAGQASKA
jgi:asparagine synthetase B (glutamine-hydrolysing)